ncbi:MAG TPA: TolC family protein [Polyangiaceae bacterium]|nr:TolC family protein [Polyangiaceae bacterium]
MLVSCPRSIRLGVALFTAALSSAGRAAAEEPASIRALALNAAVDFALKHQPEVLAARKRLIASRADAEVPIAQWQPNVGLVAEALLGTANNSTASILSPRTVDLPRIGGTSVEENPSARPYGSSLVALGVRQEVFDFGRIAAQAAAVRALAATDKERLRAQRLDTVLSVTEAYYAVLAARTVVEVAGQAEARARMHRDYADAGVRSGLRSPIELTRAEADVTRFEVNRIRAEGGLRVARSVFAAAVGVDDPELDAGPDTSAPFQLPDHALVQARARDADPAVRVAVSRSRAQDAVTAVLKASERPNIYASAAVSGRAGGAPASDGVVPQGDGALPIVPNYSAGLVLEWPMYDAVTLARERASKQRELALLAEVDVARQRAVTRSEQAYRDAEVALRALDALSRAAEAARANHDQAEARFKQGLGTSVELADAETLRIDAELQLAIGKFQLAVDRAVLLRTMTEEP